MVRKMVVPPATRPRTVSQTARRDRGSSPVVGSSRKMIEGSPTKVMARSRRLVIPPEYSATRRSAASVRSKSCSNRSTRSRVAAFERCRRRATMVRFSRPVSSVSTAANWPVRPICAQISARSVRGSSPATSTSPASCCDNVDRIFTVVVFPEPLGPSRANTVPAGTSRSIPSRTVWSPKDFVSPVARMAVVVMIVLPVVGETRDKLMRIYACVGRRPSLMDVAGKYSVVLAVRSGGVHTSRSSTSGRRAAAVRA